MDKDTRVPRNNDNDTDISVAEERAAKDTISAQRRRLIQASAAAVPAIVTLHSSVAAATSALGCVEKDAKAAPAEELVLTQDTWVRKIGTLKYKIKISLDNNAWGSNADYLIVDGKYYEYNGTSYELFNVNGETVYEKKLTTGTTVYVLCYIEFGADGTVLDIKYYPDTSGNGAQVTTSCLCSVNPAYNLPG